MSDSAKEKYERYVSELNTRKKILLISTKPFLLLPRDARDAKNYGWCIAVLCPNCNLDPFGNCRRFGDNRDEKCPNCGQLLDWSVD